VKLGFFGAISPPRVETRAVLAGAYVNRDGATLTHAVEVDGDRWPTRVLCGRAKVDNLADEGAGDCFAAPTCPLCVKKLARLARETCK